MIRPVILLCAGLLVIAVAVYVRSAEATKLENKVLRDEIETGRAIDEAPTFSAGDPAARKRLCQLLDLSDCPMRGNEE